MTWNKYFVSGFIRKNLDPTKSQGRAFLFLLPPLIPPQPFPNQTVSSKSGREENLIMSYLESVLNQNKKHYQYIYEGKSNYMHIFGVYFIFDWSHIHRKENCQSILYS